MALSNLAAFWLLLLCLPFRGAITELLLVVVAGAAMTWPISVFFRLGERLRLEGLARQSKPVSLGTALRLAILMVGFVSLVATTMSGLLDRLNYASRLRWVCDGLIIERTRAGNNHNAPTLVVESSGRKGRFEMVDEALWDRARRGQRLAKRAGSATALLEGERFRMVPLQLQWRNDPDR